MTGATDRPMYRAEASNLGQHIWGYGWQGRLAEAVGVQDRTVRRWIAADSLPDFAASKLRAMAHISPPPPGTTPEQDRDDACADAVEGDLSRLVELATDAGWHRAEVQVAILSLIVTDMTTLAGPAAALEVLAQAKSLVEEVDRRQSGQANAATP